MKRVGSLAAVLLLSGCQIFGDDGPPPPCPQVSVLAEAAQLTQFLPGPGKDLIDILFESEVVNVASSCEYITDEETGKGTIDVEVSVITETSRGPADKTRAANLPYFVTLLDSGQQVMSKSNFALPISFPGNLSRATTRDDPVTVSIPIQAGQTGQEFRIFVGFQLTREQLQFNRERNAATRGSR